MWVAVERRGGKLLRRSTTQRHRCWCSWFAYPWMFDVMLYGWDSTMRRGWTCRDCRRCEGWVMLDATSTQSRSMRHRSALPCPGAERALRAAVEDIGLAAAVGLKDPRYNPLPLYIGRTSVFDPSCRPRSEKAALVQRRDHGDDHCVGCPMLGRCLLRVGTSG